MKPTDTIADIKSHLASQSGAPPADVQRLLLKGKALADGKLLKEYSVKDGDTVNLMVKPGFDWDPTKPSAVPVPEPEPKQISVPAPLSLAPESADPDSKRSRSHQRIPSVILSPSPNALTPTGEDKPVDIPLTLDAIGSPNQGSIPVSSYQSTVSQPGYWEQLLGFLL